MERVGEILLNNGHDVSMKDIIIAEQRANGTYTWPCSLSRDEFPVCRMNRKCYMAWKCGVTKK
jgi:hypothetical protein